jgi:hypothetical protein
MSMAEFNASAITVPPGSVPPAPTQMGYYGAAFFDSAVGYRIPGVADVNGDPTKVASGSMVYGYNSPLGSPNTGFFQDLTCVIRFEADTVLMESANSPPATQAADWGAPFPSYPVLVPPTPAQILNLDLNNDGDQTDTFVTGKIVRYIIACPTNTTLLAANASNPSPSLLMREVLSDTALFRVSGTGAGQFNGDVESHAGAPNYSGAPSYSGVLFGFVDQTGTYTPGIPTLNFRGLLVTVWHGNADDTGKAWILRNNKILIRFRVPQS